MFPEMRRGRQALIPAECAEVLERGADGVLAVLGENGYPYTVPLNYVYVPAKIASAFAGANAGEAEGSDELDGPGGADIKGVAGTDDSAATEATGRIYFHGAFKGAKMDALSACDKVSFCVVDKREVVVEKYTTAFKSVVVFGRARKAEGEEALAALTVLAGKYCPEMPYEQEAQSSIGHTCVIALDIEHITGKQGKELMH